MTACVLRGDARRLPLPDGCVDLLVTSPPYFGLRSYTDGGEHYAGQIGSEATPAEWVAALVECTREWCRVLKPEGSLFVNLGDKYDARQGAGPNAAARGAGRNVQASMCAGNPKSLLGLPWRYALACTDQLGLILRRDIIWAKPNGLPESVTDRCRSSHEYLFHLVKQPRYYSAVDEIREPQAHGSDSPTGRDNARRSTTNRALNHRSTGGAGPLLNYSNPLGKLPGSVWSIPSQPLQVPAHLGVDHFAAFPMELPRRLILGWSPPGVCTACGHGRRPVVQASRTLNGQPVAGTWDTQPNGHSLGPQGVGHWRYATAREHAGYACACYPPPRQLMPGLAEQRQTGEGFDLKPPPTRPAVVLDPFGGTGTTALVASVLGRHGITADLSADYCRLAAWRTTDPGERAKALQVPKPPPVPDGQEALFPW